MTVMETEVLEKSSKSNGLLAAEEGARMDAETELETSSSGIESHSRSKIEVNRPYYTQSNFNIFGDYSKGKQTFKSRCSKMLGGFCPPSLVCCKKTALSLFPFIGILSTYSRSDFLNDVISGLTVGVMHIPQGMAYGMLANIDPVYGLYTSFFPVIMYFFLGTSRHISMGTFAVVSLMIGSVVDKFDCSAETTIWYRLQGNNSSNVSFMSSNNDTAISSDKSRSITEEDQHQIEMCKVGLVMAVTFVAGILQLLMGLCRFGFVTIYLSDPLTRALTTGAGVHVFTSQIKHVFGIRTGRFSGSLKLVYTYIVFFTNIAKTNIAALVMSIICIIIIYSLQRWVSPRLKRFIRMPLPAELILLIFGTLISYLAKFSSTDGFNMKVVGPIPHGMPPPAFPPASKFSSVWVDAIAIALVSFTINISMAKLFSTKHGYNLDSNQELISYGITNIVCSSLNCYVSTASLSRSLVQESVGGRTQVAGLISCLLLLVVLLAVGPLFQELPNCVLAAIIIVNLRGIFLQVKDLKYLSQISLYDMLTWIVTCVAVILTDVDVGLIIGVGFSLLSIVFRTQSPHTHVLGQVPKTDIYEDVQHYSSAKEIPNIKIFSFNSSLYYANAAHFIDKLHEKTGCNPSTIKSERSHQEQRSKQHDICDQTRKRRFCFKLNRKQELSAVLEAVESNEKNNLKEEEIIVGSDPSKSDPSRSDPSRSDLSNCIISDIIIDCTSVVFIDSVGISTLKQVVQDYADIGVRVSLARCNDEVFEVVRKAVAYKAMVNCKIFLTVHDAVMSSMDEESTLKTNEAVMSSMDEESTLKTNEAVMSSMDEESTLKTNEAVITPMDNESVLKSNDAVLLVMEEDSELKSQAISKDV